MQTTKPRVYIAGPFFNQPQIDIIRRIQGMLTERGYSYYSPMLDSGSHLLSQEDRKDPEKWKLVFQSNVDELHKCQILLAVVEYASPPEKTLCLVDRSQALDMSGFVDIVHGPVELPDSGTVWEMGYVRALGDVSKPQTPIIGFHSTKSPDKMNLMLSHGVDQMFCGWDELGLYLDHPYLSLFFSNKVTYSGEVE